MAIYCIILSAQHKCRTMSVSLCHVGPRRTASLKQTKQQRWHFIGHPRGSSMMLHCMPLSVSFELICVCACVYSFAFVCTFPALTGEPAAVLESLLTESVGPAGYFYPLACVREQVEALWATTRSHSDEWRYAAICGCSGQTSRSEHPSYKDTACDGGKGRHWQITGNLPI